MKFKGLTQAIKRLSAGAIIGGGTGAVVGYDGSPLGLKKEGTREGMRIGIGTGLAIVSGGLAFKPALRALAGASKAYAATLKPGAAAVAAKPGVVFRRVRGRIIPIRAK